MRRRTGTLLVYNRMKLETVEYTEREQYLLMGPKFNIYTQGLLMHPEVKIRISEVNKKHTIIADIRRHDD